MLINDAVANPVRWYKAAAKKAKDLEKQGRGSTAADEAEIQQHAEAVKTYTEQGNNVEVGRFFFSGLQKQSIALNTLLICSIVCSTVSMQPSNKVRSWRCLQFLFIGDNLDTKAKHDDYCNHLCCFGANRTI
jgi:hypothetical protein